MSVVGKPEADDQHRRAQQKKDGERHRKAFAHLSKAQQQLRCERQRHAKLVKDLLEHRQNLGHQRQQNHGDENPHQTGVDHHATHRPLGLILLAIVSGERVKNLLCLSGGLADFHHVQQVMGKGPRLFEGRVERQTLSQRMAKLLKQGLLPGLLGVALQRLDSRFPGHTRLPHKGELIAQHGNLIRCKRQLLVFRRLLHQTPLTLYHTKSKRPAFCKRPQPVRLQDKDGCGALLLRFL